MVEHHGPPLSLGDLPQRLNQQHMVRFRWRYRGRRALPSGEGERGAHPPPPADRQPSVHRAHPCLGGAVQVQLGPAFPGPDEGLLDHILRLGEVACHRIQTPADLVAARSTLTGEHLAAYVST